MSWLITSVRGVPTLTAIARATAAGWRCWTPTLVERRRVRGRRGRVTVATPAFPAYVLLFDVDNLDRLRAGFRGWHVTRLQGRDAVQSDAAVEALRDLEAVWHEAALRPPPPRARFEPGAAVTVSNGLFTGHRGRITTDDGGPHVDLDLSRLGKCRLPHACLAAAP